MMDIATFRAVFPEFGDSAKYPDAQVQYYLDFAVQSLRPEAWRNLLERGTGLFVAHYLAMSAISRAGTIPGRGQLGIVASKSVGPASISYDNSAISAQADAGHWALTSYGLMYWELMRMVGTGGWQL
jgi:hypothetical protein